MTYYGYRLIEKIKTYITKSGKEFSSFKIFSKIFAFSLNNLISHIFAFKPKSHKLNIGFIFSGGIGDQVISAQWVKVFIERLLANNCEFYSVLMFPNKQTGNMLVAGFKGIDLIESRHYLYFHKFDLLIGVDQFAKIFKINDRAVSKYAPFLKEDLSKALEFTRRYGLLSYYNYHYQLMNLAVTKGWNRYDLMGACGLCDFNRQSPVYFQIEQSSVTETCKKFNLPSSFITIHSGVGNVPVSEQSEEAKKIARRNASRCIPLELGNQIVAKIHELQPDLKIIQIGDESGYFFEGVDLNLCGKTSFKESLDLLYESLVHIDNDAGLIHLRHVMGKRSVVLYGPTDARFVGYDTDVNFQGNCRPCMWLTEDWNTVCPAGFSKASCMYSIKASEVAKAVLDLVGENDAGFSVKS